MQKLFSPTAVLSFCLLFIFLVSCNRKNKSSTNKLVNEIGLKRGELISCGPPGKEFGSVAFETSCPRTVKADFNLAMAMLHSFEYDESEKLFAKIIDKEPGCALAYWGVAMSNYHPLWTPPTEAELEKGAKAIAVAQSLEKKSKIETEYINAIATFYNNWQTRDHRSRSMDYVAAMANMHAAYPDDKEAAIFYALALTAIADPADKSFANQKKAGDILTGLYPEGSAHPGIVHYIIHTYDSPELAELALSAAREYASIAPSSAHAQHMPSHIFTRLGLWDECISSNLVAAASAKCYAENAGMKGHWDEELHALDYLVYGYLQKGDNKRAKKQWDYLRSINDVQPVNFKVFYAFAAIPSRYVLENKMWNMAARLDMHPANFPWEEYPWQKGIIHFTRLLGSVHIGRVDAAKEELANLHRLHERLVEQKNPYMANQVDIQIKTGEAWILFKEGSHAEALKQMRLAAAMEDKTEKHAVTPGEVLPAIELLADMYLLLDQPVEALAAYEANLKKHPNRFNGLFGAATAGEKINDPKKAATYYRQLLAIADSSNGTRGELEIARQFLASEKAIAFDTR